MRVGGDRTGPGPVLAVGLLLAALTSAPHVRAALTPPPGTRFVGTFHFVDDFYNYLGFAQQAEDGAWIFRNRLSPEVGRPSMINVEWAVVGRLSRAFGRRPAVAYRLFGAAMTVLLLAGVDRWLRRAGLPSSHRLAALLLVGFGGGVGGLLFEWTDVPVWRCLDVSMGLYPFFEALANPHWVAGTALLVWTLLGLSDERRPLALGALFGTILALTRPYDVVLAAAIHAVAVISTDRPASWPRRLWPLVGLLPAVAYDVWLFFIRPDFRSFSRLDYRSFAAVDLVPALLPPLALALVGRRRPGPPHPRHALWIWALLAVAAHFAPIHFGTQLVVGAGTALLMLAALALAAAWPPTATAAAALALSTSSIVAVRVTLRPDPNWMVAVPRLAAAEALRPQCHPRELLLSPPDIGLYALGLTSCDPWVSHDAAPEHDARSAAARAFYADSDPEERERFLDQVCIRHLVLPGDAGERPLRWLGLAAPFRRTTVIASPSDTISLYVRDRPCRPS